MARRGTTRYGAEHHAVLVCSKGCCKEGDAEGLRRRRATEPGHDLASMLACMRNIAPAYFKSPDLCLPSQDLQLAKFPNCLAALSKVTGAGWLREIGVVAAMEKRF